MVADSCIFCEMVNGKVHAYRIYEDNEFLAFLDRFPNIKGQALVIPKAHMESYLFGLEDEFIRKYITVVKKVSKMLESKLGDCRIHLVFEGTGVNHVHAKLYPAIGTMNKKFEKHVEHKAIYFDEYPGFISTVMGPEASDADLKKIWEEIVE